MARKKKMFRSSKTARRQARKRRSTIAERRKKEFLWRGLNMEELSALPLYLQRITQMRHVSLH